MASVKISDDIRSLGDNAQLIVGDPSAEDKLHSKARIFAKSADDEICITGLAGAFPSSRNVAEFEHNLWNKIDMVSEQNARWPPFHPEIPKRMGNISDIDKFDSQFFGVHYRQAESLDPQGRMLQEKAYEAVMDAGVHPRSLRGSRTGVFIGTCFAEAEKTWFYEKTTERGFGITGCSRAMMANRISYSLGLQGPSLVVDTACSSSMYALDLAFSHIRSGQCESAIVGGSNLLLQPSLSLQFARLGVLSNNGHCQPFEKDASGYIRAEAVCAIYLQKAKHAKRIYANLLYTKTNCDGHKEQGITFPSGKVQQNLLTEFYSDLTIDTATIDYVEAHGTGTVVGDPEECVALDNVMCRNRNGPLLVGSVKSNMGHSEASSGLCSIAKVILALERGEVPANINFVSNRLDIPSIVQNRIKVCSEATKLPENAMVGINSFGFGGANAHALLQGNETRKMYNGRPIDDIPRLVNWSGRTEESISVMIDYLRSVPLDAEYIGLLHGIQSVEESGFLQRGFGVFASGQSNNAPAICLSSGDQRFEGVKRPLVWIFSGMGSQWPAMGRSLMVIPLFKESIMKSHLLLQPVGIDLIQIITDPDTNVFDFILNSFVGIAAIQIALVDVLKALNIKPDYIIGHSVGELGCAYADGVFNQEQMIMSAYYRGVASVNVDLIRGSMAAIGLGYNVIKDMLPADIFAACHNSAESTTISGPEESVTAFVSKMTKQNIFAKGVKSSNIAYHSRYVAQIGRTLLELTSDLYPPIRRSDKWLSTSVPHSQWNEPKNRFSNAEYYANNLLNSVLFEETCALLPPNSIAIEIAPHGILQAIVKRSMPTTVHIPLTQRGNLNNAAFFLNALGRLYVNGWTMPLEKLYLPINYPVSRGTAKISPLLRWDHSVSLFVPKFELNKNPESGERRFTINLANEEFAYVAGHQIDGRCLFPATGYLEMVWKTFAMMKRSEQQMFNVEFEDVQFLRATALQQDTEVELTVMIHYGNGTFEVSEGTTSIMTGVVREVEVKNAVLTELSPMENSVYPMLNQDDFYKEMRLRGYHYKGDFQSVIKVRSDGVDSRIRWNQNWVSFMDCILQTMIISKESRSLILPTRIQKVRIFPQEHLKKSIELRSRNEDFEVYFNEKLNIVQAGGVEIVGLVTNAVSRRKAVGKLVLESYKFIEYNISTVLSQHEAYRICVQLLIENNPSQNNFKVLEVQSSSTAELAVTFLDVIFSEIPLVTAKVNLLTDRQVELPNVTVENTSISTHTNCHLIILSDAPLEYSLLDSCQDSLSDQGFVIIRKPNGIQSKDLSILGLNIIAKIPTETETVYLLRKRQTTLNDRLVVDITNSKDFDWIDKIKESTKSTSLLLVSQNNTFSGIIGLVNCMKREPNFQGVSCVFIDDNIAPKFDLTDRLYADQLALNLAINVYRHGSWGSYRHIKLIQEKMRTPRSNHYYVNTLRPGDLSSFSWLQGPLNHQANNQLIRVQYSAINFKDVMLATGRLSSDIFNINRLDKECLLGIEYAGTTVQGQRVMGMVASGSMGTIIKPFEPLTWIVPKEWTLQEAATVPVVYSTVYCAFFMGKAISAGKSILIHAGSGGVGLAAIRVALAYNMEVYTTVSNGNKKKYILDLFPKLKDCNIGNSRDCSFEQLIMRRTCGKGVDYVLNSLSDEKLHASIRCLGRAGVFLEIGKFDMSNDTKVGLSVFLKEMSFRSVLAENLFKQPHEETRYIHCLIERDLKTGIIQPLKSTVFQVDEIEKAYRYLSTGQHIGKVMIQVRREAQDELSVPISAWPRAYFNADKVYIIPGGLGGFGLELADWLVLRGARKIVLSSSRGLSNSYQTYRIRIWKNYGCQTIISTADITKADGCRALIDEAQQYGPIDGIFNLAVCLRDGIFENQTAEWFKESLAPKSDATIHFDEITRQMEINLKYFVVFSSISCGRGNAGQSSYGFANSVMERIIEKRVSDGFSGKAIQWGAIGEVGLAAAMTANNVEAEIAGTVVQRISSCINELDILLTTPDPIVGSMVVAKKQDSLISGKKKTLIEMVLNIMCIQSKNSISMTTSLSDLGVDSLMTIEIKQALEREFEIYMSSKDLRATTFQMLQTLSDSGAESSIAVPKTKGEIKDLFNFDNIQIEGSEEHREPINRLPSKSTADSFDESVLIMPGVEGDSNPGWRLVCKQINVPTFIANYNATLTKTTVLEIAKTYAQFYLETLPKQKTFLVIGYSFGALVAIEVARILEISGLSGHILCIDGSPVFLKKLVLKSIKADHFTLRKLENLILDNIASTCLPTLNLETFNERLFMLDDWQPKIQSLIDLLAVSECKIIEKYLLEAVTGFYNRSVATFFYSITNRIQSDVTLVRPTEASITDIDEMYELHSHTEGTVSLKYVEGNHHSVLESSSLANIVNKILKDS